MKLGIVIKSLFYYLKTYTLLYPHYKNPKHNVLMQKKLDNSLLPNGYYCTISSNFYQIFEPLKINYNIDLSVISRLYF